MAGEAATVVSGYRVAQVDFGAIGQKLGAYYQTGRNTWKEIDIQGRAAHAYVETNRDQGSVYLEDASRKVKIQIDLTARKIRCSTPTIAPRVDTLTGGLGSDTTIREQYDVLSSATVNGWMLAEATVAGTNTPGDNPSVPGGLGSDTLDSRDSFYIQSGPKSWYQRDSQGKKMFDFTETKRDDWTVYLVDLSRKISIEIDIWTKKVFCSDSKISRRVQGNVLSTAPVNGWTVGAAVFGAGAMKSGEFRRVVGTKNWQELDKNGEVIFGFVESNRDEWSVYMKDASRNVSIQIDIFTQKIFYSDAKTPRREQCQILFAK